MFNIIKYVISLFVTNYLSFLLVSLLLFIEYLNKINMYVVLLIGLGAVCIVIKYLFLFKDFIYELLCLDL